MYYVVRRMLMPTTPSYLGVPYTLHTGTATRTLYTVTTLNTVTAVTCMRLPCALALPLANALAGTCSRARTPSPKRIPWCHTWYIRALLRLQEQFPASTAAYDYDVRELYVFAAPRSTPTSACMTVSGGASTHPLHPIFWPPRPLAPPAFHTSPAAKRLLWSPA